jgi:hypothetical protein
MVAVYPDMPRQEDGAWVTTGPAGFRVRWQEGPLAQGINGATPDLMVRALIQRIEQLQREVPHELNAAIIRSLNAVLGQLDARIRDRHNRGVLGSAVP